MQTVFLDYHYTQTAQNQQNHQSTCYKLEQCQSQLKLSYTMTGWPKQVDPELHGYHARQNEITVEDGCLLWGMRVIVPHKLRCLKELHHTHTGIVRMKSLARIHVWWPRMDRDIESEVRSCGPCQTVRNWLSRAPLHVSGARLSQNTSFHFSQIEIHNVYSILNNLKANKSTGLDKIPAKILKLSAEIIAPSLTYIFNLSLASGIYLNEWKRARVTPIYKSEDKTKCENYRPISILPVISKVLEKEIFRQVYGYLTDNDLLSKLDFVQNILLYPHLYKCAMIG